MTILDKIQQTLNKKLLIGKWAIKEVLHQPKNPVKAEFMFQKAYENSNVTVFAYPANFVDTIKQIHTWSDEIENLLSLKHGYNQLNIRLLNTKPLDNFNSDISYNVMKGSYDITINISDKQSIVHEIGHVLDHAYHPFKESKSTTTAYNSIHCHYINQLKPYKSELLKHPSLRIERDYYDRPSESWARFFQQWYEDINPSLTHLKLTEEFMDKSHEVAKEIYNTDKSIKQYFIDVLPHVYVKSEEYQILTKEDLPNSNIRIL